LDFVSAGFKRTLLTDRFHEADDRFHLFGREIVQNFSNFLFRCRLSEVFAGSVPI
jgi:hypothetical protein